MEAYWKSKKNLGWILSFEFSLSYFNTIEILILLTLHFEHSSEREYNEQMELCDWMRLSTELGTMSYDLPWKE